MAGRARTFTKNLANYMSLGNKGLGTLLSGASVFSVAARVKLGTGLTGAANDNNILTALLNGVTLGFALSIDGTGPKLRCSLRSVSTDGKQSASATTVLTTGSTYYMGAVVNVGAKTFAWYVNGVADGSASGLTLANATWTLGNPTDNDAVGGYRAAPVATADQFDGEISQVALWNMALGVSDFAALASGTLADQVQIANLLWYLKIDGITSPELPTVGTPQGTITGSLPVAGQVFPRTIAVGASRATTLTVGANRGSALTVGANQASVVAVTASRAVTQAVGANRATTIAVGASQ